ncbi:unnamed protein product [Boreogadus saida]
MARSIERATREQSGSAEWHNLRKMRLTSSRFRDVCHVRGHSSAENLAERIRKDSQSKPPLEPQEDLQTWGHQLHHSVRFGDSSRTQKQSGPAPLDDSQDLQTVGNQPPHSVRLRDLFSDSDATLSRYSGAPGRPLAATTPFLGHRYFRT